MVVLIVFILLGTLDLTVGMFFEAANITLMISENSSSWADSSAICQKHGGHLVTVETNYVRETLSKLMAIAKFQRMWIGAKSSQKEWSWIGEDSIVMHGNFTNWMLGAPERKDSYPLCTMMVGSDDFSWLDHPCAMPHAFLCQRDIQCGQSRSSFDLVQRGTPTCYSLHQATYSWYQAQEYCHQHSGYLAVFTNQKDFQEVKSHLRKEIKVSGDYWIGSTDTVLHWPDGSIVMKTFWEGGQPSRRGNCVHMERFGENAYRWANKECGEKVAFACTLPQMRRSKSVNRSDEDDRWRPCPACASDMNTFRVHHNLSLHGFINSIIYCALAFGVGCLIMAIPLSIYIIKLKKRQNQNSLMNNRVKVEEKTGGENKQYENGLAAGGSVGYGATTGTLTYPRNLYQAYKASQKYGADPATNEHGYSDNGVLYNV